MVEWEIHTYEGNGMENKLVQITDTHICNDKDWSKFHNPSFKSRSTFQKLKESDVMYCPNKLDREGKLFNDVKLFGPDDTSINRHLEIVFKPCTPG